MNTHLEQTLLRHQHTFHPVVKFEESSQQLLLLDFTKNNTALSNEILSDTDKFTHFIEQLLSDQFIYGIGGYDEHRTIYARSEKFDGDEEPRRLHLGIDIWGKAGTPIYAPLGGYVHSFNFNDAYGDYGATIILQHQLDSVSFNTLYGHLSLSDLSALKPGQYISRGVEFAHFGIPNENGHWPPHLHFQLVENMYQHSGDYPGVCKFSEREKWLYNSPNPDVVLQMMKYVK